MSGTRASCAKLACALIAGLLGCGEAEPPLDAHALATQHAARLDELSRWARRLDSTAPAFGSREALEEAAFARYRRDDDVLAAWIEREGPDPGTLAHPHGAVLPDVRWQRARVEALGEVEVAQASLPGGTAILLRRRQALPDGATLAVVLAVRPGIRP